ncbi:unnamed protein product, partial [Adineta steineri]
MEKRACLNRNYKLKSLISYNSRCTPALTFILSTLVLKKQKLSLKLGLCVFAITFGAVITSAGDLTFHGESYLIGGLSVIFQSLYLLTIQRCSEQKNIFGCT